ncbi:branched-chain amino acid transport system II carrier protein [Fructobacillus sp. M1-13]|nr:branched-chain amino acid transport system II carrier protein [Fructobacillus papyriferae]
MVPIQLGQSSAYNWLPAVIGFFNMGALLPFLTMLAVSITKSESIYDIAKPVAPWFGTAFLVAVQFTIGPLFASPRTPQQPLTWESNHWFQLAITRFLCLFLPAYSLPSYLLTVKDSNLMKWVRQYLNPISLGLLALILVLAQVLPMGNLQQQAADVYANIVVYTIVASWRIYKGAKED